MNTTIQLQLARVQQKLAEAKTQQRSCFGSTVHGFELTVPLAENAIVAFERHYQVDLPEDYRAFLLMVGQSGAGPYYGLASLSAWYDGTSLPPNNDDTWLMQSFPLTYEQAISSTEMMSRVNYDDFCRGSIYLCDQGCAYCARLVISGEARGRIVYLDQSDTQPPYFVRDHNFLDWYERWLDGVLAGNLPLWFAFDNPAYAQKSSPRLASEAQMATQRAIPPGPYKEQLERMRAKLLGSWDITQPSGFRMALSTEQLAKFEDEYQVRLPLDYAAFISTIQAGGIGPYHGLTPFEFAIPPQADAETLRTPFPYTRADLKRAGMLPVHKRQGSVYFPGTLYLCHQNRGYYAWLVVTGEARGQVVYVNMDDAWPPYFVQKANFLEWYESWIDAALAHTLPPWWFGYDNPDYTLTNTESLTAIRWTLNV